MLLANSYVPIAMLRMINVGLTDYLIGLGFDALDTWRDINGVVLVPNLEKF